MLALVERYFDFIAKSRRDADVVDLMGKLANELGFQSAFLIEYNTDLNAAVHAVDTNSGRANAWNDYIASSVRSGNEQLLRLLERGPLVRLQADRFPDPTDQTATSAGKLGLTESTLLPISHDGKFVGICGFTGNPELDRRWTAALPLIVYTLFAQVRSFRQFGITTSSAQLTPREKEVIALSAEGLTSTEIAAQLGMSARTANQHFDNVSAKLGTKNRAHTVAEAIRHNLL